MEGVSSEDNEIFIEFSPDAIHKVRKYYHKCYLCSLINLKGDCARTRASDFKHLLAVNLSNFLVNMLNI